MMFDVQCLGCKQSIGKGVRFNAKKVEVGKYLSTKIYDFEMTCRNCNHKLVVRTDPQNCDYVMQEGLKRIRAEATSTAPVQEVVGAFSKLEKQKIDFDVGQKLKPQLE